MCIKTIALKKYDIIVPCGKCVECIERRISQWQFRLKQEEKISTSAYFVTLTYNDENLVYGSDAPTLVKKDLQDFFKRLRYYEKNNKNIKYYAVGEYGTKTKRPHYHAIVFNIRDPLNIERAWTKGFTYSPVLSGSSGTRYVLKYISKQTRKVSGREREFSLMSKGLGANYLSPAIIKYHKNLENCYITDDGYKKSMPKYYKEKLYDELERATVTQILQNRVEELKQLEIKKLSKRLKNSSVNDLLNIIDSRNKSRKFDPRKREIL